MRFLRRSLSGLFLLSLTAGLLIWAGYIVSDALQSRISEEGFSPPSRERVFAVSVVPVEVGAQTPVMVAFGEVQSLRQLEIRPAIPGRVTHLSENMVEGGRVDEGALLLEIDPADAQTALALAQSDLIEAEAELEDASSAQALAQEDLAVSETQAALRIAALERQLDLQERGVGSAAAVETAELASASADQAVVSRRQSLAQAIARVAQAEQHLNRQLIVVSDAERALEDTEIRAAFSGALGEVSVTQGGLVGANERVAILTDPEQLEVAFRISTEQYARLRGDNGLTYARITVTLGAGGADLTAMGQISRESALVGEGQTGRLIFAELEVANGLRPGDFVAVHIEEPELRGVSLLPATAVNAQNQVLLLGEDDRLEEADVVVLRRQGDMVIVRAPELAGRDVVSARTPLLGVGLRVEALGEGEVDVPEEEPETVTLTPERRAELIAFVEANQRMPADVKERLMTQLQQDEVPAEVIERLESRMTR